MPSDWMTSIEFRNDSNGCHPVDYRTGSLLDARLDRIDLRWLGGFGEFPIMTLITKTYVLRNLSISTVIAWPNRVLI